MRPGEFDRVLAHVQRREYPRSLAELSPDAYAELVERGEVRWRWRWSTWQPWRVTFAEYWLGDATGRTATRSLVWFIAARLFRKRPRIPRATLVRSRPGTT